MHLDPVIDTVSVGALGVLAVTGGSLVTIDGWFPDVNASEINVTLGGVPCLNASVVVPQSRVTCTASAGTGTSLRVPAQTAYDMCCRAEHVAERACSRE